MKADLPDASLEEIRRATKKNDERDAQITKAGGVTSRSRAIASKWFPVLDAELKKVLEAPNDDPALRVFLAQVAKLGSARLALCILQGALQDIGKKDDNYRESALRIGRNIHIECYAAGLFKGYPKNAATKIKQRSKGKPNLARALVLHHLYKMPDWSPAHLITAGTWGVDQLMTFLPGAFRIEERLFNKDRRSKKQSPEKVLVLTPEALEYAESSGAELIRRNRPWLPKPQAPANWEDWDKGGTSDKISAGSLRIVRDGHEITARAVRKAIRDGTMQPTIDALNALQAVPWTINKPVLNALRQCDLHGVDVEGVPPGGSIKRVAFELDMRTAESIAAYGRFWTAMNLDWRGRVYGVPHFNFQRDDAVRALFLFADGEPVGADGLRWLKVHTANCGDGCGDGSKISKRPFDERVAWVDENIEKIKGSAASPLEQRWWTEADKPFQFLAACFELASAREQGPTLVSRLPVSFDGSCSGLQHLSAMTRDEETAPLVNLLPQKVPQDIYGAVAKRVKECVDRNVDVYEDGHLAQMWLNYGIDRKVVKQNVMSYFYSSNAYGMAKQQREELMQELADKVESGKLKTHPFEGASDAAAKYIADQVYLTIKNGIKRPAVAMEFLQRISTAMSEAGLYPQWTTPAGFPWTNRYYKPKTDQIRLYLDSLGSFRILLATGEEPEIDKKKAKSGIAANFVHACDAAHLMLTVNAAVSEGITSIATVHDCFGCLPSRAERFRKIIREQFVRMYEENDVLAQMLEQARKDLNEPNAKRMPSAPPSRGSLDIKNVRDAEFAFA